MAYGQLQYKYNHIEEARNTFETLLRNSPKRSDIWIVYVDKEIKFGNFDKVRNVFEKCLSIDFKVKTLKTIIKKYLEFETTHGNEHTLKHVKELTHKIIHAKLSELDNGEEEEMQLD